MKDSEKRELARLVRWEIDAGRSKTATIDKLKGLGFKKRTIGVYYEVFKKPED